MLKNLTII